MGYTYLTIDTNTVTPTNETSIYIEVNPAYKVLSPTQQPLTSDHSPYEVPGAAPYEIPVANNSASPLPTATNHHYEALNEAGVGEATDEYYCPPERMGVVKSPSEQYINEGMGPPNMRPDGESSTISMRSPYYNTTVIT